MHVRVAVVPLDLCDHVDTRRMASAELFRFKEIVNDHLGQFRADDALAHRDDLAVVVLLDHLRGIAVRADARADAGHLIRRQGNSYTGAAYEHAFIHFAVLDRFRHSPARDRIIHLFLRAVSAEVHTLISFLGKVFNETCLKFDRRVITSESDFHVDLLTVKLIGYILY